MERLFSWWVTGPSHADHTHQAGNSLLFNLSSGDLSALCFQSRDDRKKKTRERRKQTRGANFPFCVTNKEINKSLWAFDRLWWGGAVGYSWTIYEAVTTVSLSLCVGWLVGEREYCLKYLNVCVRFTPDLWPRSGDGSSVSVRSRRATDSVWVDMNVFVHAVEWRVLMKTPWCCSLTLVNLGFRLSYLTSHQWQFVSLMLSDAMFPLPGLPSINMASKQPPNLHLNQIRV